MRSYEIVLVVKTGSDTERKKIVSFVTDLLKGMKVVKEEDLGSKALAYKIKHELSGHFYNLTVEGDMIPSDFEKKVLENQAVLRHLVLRNN
ncbi:MAG TPA: 30S ribosomal protein S6 [Candidatus Eisenbacteria bacterium]|nr:30S ribosomal protein S6 [Candidatus Eisenbacteria bacterium]